MLERGSLIILGPPELKESWEEYQASIASSNKRESVRAP